MHPTSIFMKDFEQEIKRLCTEHKIKLDISQFLLLKADIQLQQIKTKQRLQKLADNNKELQREISEVKQTIDDALKTALEAKDRIERARNKLKEAQEKMRAARWVALKEYKVDLDKDNWSSN